jgi:multiple sugar transport system permease protein
VLPSYGLNAKINKKVAMMRTILHYVNKPERAAYLFIFPAMAILLVFTGIPLFATLMISLLRMDIFLKDAQWVGFENFSRLLVDDKFWNALLNTVYFTGVSVPLQVAIALLAAVFLSRNTGFRKFVRSALFLPTVCSFTAIGIMWSFLLDPQSGLYPHYLVQLGLPRLEFLRDPDLAMPSVILMTVWRSFGFSMIILVAGIQNIPDSYYEAAEINGAGKQRQFFSITIPMLIPSLSFCIITATITALQVFDQIFVTTQGGPLDRTETMVTYIYNVGFKYAPYEMGYASAISVALLTIIMATTLSMNRYFLTKESTDSQ